MNYNLEELQDRIKTIANLPTLPHIASRLMQIVNSPNTSADTVAALVSQDISLSAKVLRLANSAFYGIPKSINTLNNAVVILGFKIIQTMVLSLTVFDMFTREDDEDGASFDRNAFWKHSLRCAVIARLLAHRRRRTFALDPEEAFCAGLLHDVGKVVMEQYLNQDFHKALNHARTNGVSIFEAERDVLGYTHCDVASWLTGSWSLPDEIEQPLVCHHEPEEATICADSVMICHLADTLSEIDENDEDAVRETAASLEQKARMVGLSARDLTEAAAEIGAEMERASVFIGKQ
ncbi:MAG: HDOD domain-containing protein [Chitinispirillia bacterium]|nr:HDOD domain-containing protein [Chitinispirillia bacterium]MCL2268616.1 HDOD domain-containing protein [Chitinispirillia bacterium]